MRELQNVLWRAFSCRKIKSLEDPIKPDAISRPVQGFEEAKRNERIRMNRPGFVGGPNS